MNSHKVASCIVASSQATIKEAQNKEPLTPDLFVSTNGPHSQPINTGNSSTPAHTKSNSSDTLELPSSGHNSAASCASSNQIQEEHKNTNDVSNASGSSDSNCAEKLITSDQLNEPQSCHCGNYTPNELFAYRCRYCPRVICHMCDIDSVCEPESPPQSPSPLSSPSSEVSEVDSDTCAPLSPSLFSQP